MCIMHKGGGGLCPLIGADKEHGARWTGSKEKAKEDQPILIIIDVSKVEFSIF
jgi:hypothetical protein